MTPPRARTVFSLWGWLLLAPYFLTAFGGFDGARTVQEWAVGVSTAIEVHLALGAAFLLLAPIDRRLAGRPALRWPFVAVAICALAVARPTLVYLLHQVFGFDLVDTPFWLRILMNLAVLSIALLLLHSGIEAITRNLEVRRRLLTVLTSLRAQAEHIEREQERIAESFRREVTRPVIDALGRLIPRDLPPDQLAEELEWVAELVVRPISHRTHGAELDEALADIDPTLPPPAPGRTMLPPSRIVAAPAWAVTVITTVLLTPAELSANGLGLGLLLLLAGAAASFLGGLVVQRLPLPQRAAPAIAVLAIVYLLLGALSCRVLIGPSIALPQSPYYMTYGSLGFAMVALVLSIMLSARREIVANQHRIATAIGHAERRVFRARETLAADGARVGRLLHTSVQGDIVGTALRLKAGTAQPDALEELLDRVVVALRPDQALDDEPAPASAIRDALRAALTSWSHSLDLEIVLDDEALDRLAAHPSAAALANDVITEGLTNAVRHGRAGPAHVLVSVGHDGVEIRVANSGRLGSRSSGLGLADLDARARHVEIVQEGDRVVLSVLV